MQETREILGGNLEKRSKESIFGPFWALFAQIWANGIFPEKSGSVTFLRLWTPNFMQEIRKIVGANSEKKWLWTDGLTDGQTPIIS